MSKEVYMAVVSNDVMKWTADECDSCPYYDFSQLLNMTSNGRLEVFLLLPNDFADAFLALIIAITKYRVEVSDLAAAVHQVAIGSCI